MSAIDNRQDIIAVVNGHPVLIPVGPETVVSEAQDLAVKAAGYDDLPGLWETRTGHGHLLSQDARLDAPYDCSYCASETRPPWDDGRIFVTLRAGEGA